ncbi:MAG: SDR family oxidoreductase [Synechococcaceae cyanobacterium RL_1_2]|nr:SDR family oxidoreductase [Synechococcaceae cyanobacterium RL_1_2]
MDLTNQVVLVTGASSGIGQALCQEFHRCGCRVIATARSREQMTDLQRQGMAIYPLDVTNQPQVKLTIENIVQQEQRIDILVNNAGYGLMSPLIETPPSELMRQLETNTIAPIILAQAVAPPMKEQQSGLIINIGSISGIVTMPFSGAYCASKAALHALSDALRMELAPFGIQVMTVQPGAIASKFGDQAEQLASSLLKSDSWYGPLRSFILERAQISQVNATPAEQLAHQLVTRLQRPKLPQILRLGNKSLIGPLAHSLIPQTWLEKMLMHRFGLGSEHFF